MFTGIIETAGKITKINTEGTNKSFWLSAPITTDLKVDQSIAHNGVCLTVEALEQDLYKVTAILETLEKTNLRDWKTGDSINLERCLLPSSRLDGHFVQGHVDTTAKVTSIIHQNGSWQFNFSFPPRFAQLIIEKGSIAVNGISLTAFNVGPDNFSVAIIPYTYQHTNMHSLREGDEVNIEFDMLGKYLVRRLELREQAAK